jgi:hypothetical protein
MKRVAWTLLGVAILSLIGIVIVQSSYAPAETPSEVIKALLNVLTVTVVAQAVSFIIAGYNESRRIEREADQLRHRILEELNEAFVATKRIRRRVRAQCPVIGSSGTEEERRITRSIYVRSLDRLNEIQLKLEVLAKSIETHSQLFPQGEVVFSQVSMMEEYLNELIDEWEHLSIEFDGEPPTADIRKLPKMRDLIGPYKESRFRTQFVHTYYGAIERIRGSLVTSKSGQWKHPVKPAVGEAKANSTDN